MRQTIAAAALALCMAQAAALSAAAAADAPPADSVAIDRVITAQIEAFRSGDGAAAFALASPGIQRKFGDSAHFIDAVRQAYPQVYHPRSFSFGALSDAEGGLTQRVDVVGPDGALVTAVYTLERQPDGSWRIAGCSLLKTALQET